MTEKELIKQLKDLKNTPEGGMVDAYTKERTFRVLMAQIEANNGEKDKTGFFNAFGFSKYIISSRLVYTMGIIAVIFTGSFTAIASQNAMPGDTLYGAKLAVEKTHVRFTSNPATRARVQMKIAGNRLEEAKNQAGENGSLKVDETLSRFVHEVGEATKTLQQASDPEQVQQANADIAQKAVEYKQELSETKAILENNINETIPKTVVEENNVENIPEYKYGRDVVFASLEQAEKALEDAESATEEDVVEEEDSEEVDILQEGEVGL